MEIVKEIKHGHIFCGLGGGGKGFNKSNPRVRNFVGKYRCVGGIDVDKAAIKDFKQLTGVEGTVMDLFSREQYITFHGHEPHTEWREAMPADIKRAFGNERPHVCFLSAPCKGFSGLLNETLSKTDKYQALNQLTLRGIWLLLEAYADDPVEILLFENVPRIATRGRHLLNQIKSMLQHYGYAVNETTHDCGEIGGLSQSRKRFLMVARHTEKVPPFLYEPQKKSLQSVGSLLSRMPLPGDPAAGPMHRIPNLQWKTWVRLAFVEAGSDWRSLNKLAVEDGVLRDYLLVPEYRNGYLGVKKWDEHSGAVPGKSAPSNGAFSVADPRAQTGFMGAGKYIVTPFEKHANTVIAASTTGRGAFAVADPRPANQREKGDNYVNNGHYGVVPWDDYSGAVSAAAKHDNGRWSVADPRFPTANEKVVCNIVALDGTCHRPFTTLEMAALQSLVEPEEYLELDGLNDEAWRERIGNAVPSDASEEMGNVIGTTLLLAWAGETFVLSSTPIWVQPVAIALSVNNGMELA